MPRPTILADMDRCEHGRHAKDHCFDCGYPPRAGNPHLDDVVGYRVRGEPIRLRELLAVLVEPKPADA